ncbi:MAG: ECF-type sigma factor [Pirellulales bacterium]
MEEQNPFFRSRRQEVMRQVLIDKARQRRAQKRGKLKMHSLEGGILDPNDDEDILAIETALAELEKLDPLQAQIVVMRFYGGMTVDEVAESFGKSKRWVEAEWTLIKAWLRRQIATEDEK